MPAQPKIDTATVPSSPGFRGLTGQWLLISAFWLLIASASVLEATLLRSNSFTDALKSASIQWLPWVLLSPVILWLSTVCTLERATWLRNMWVHLAACILIVGGLGAFVYFESPFGPPRGQPRPFPGGDARPFPHGDPSFQPRDGQPFRDNNSPNDHRDGGPNDHPPRDGDNHHGPPGPHRGPPSPARMILELSSFQLPTYLAVLGAAHALIFSRRAKDRERRETELVSRLTQARLQALRMQLNPHFLFNTLNSIASLVYDQPRAADEMIGSLSELLRLTLSASDRQEITLREELRFLDQYLFIEQTRFGERLRIEKNIEPAALDTTVPILLLQPIVENAVKHGIESQLAPGVIGIEAQRSGDILRLRVTDNGRGPANTADGKLKEGVGLGNTRARLRELYGERGTLDFRAREGGGALVEIQIPWHAPSAPPTPASAPA
jgi:two-component sensor histidine kinase